MGVFQKIENNTHDKALFFKTLSVLEKKYIFILKGDREFELVKELKTDK